MQARRQSVVSQFRRLVFKSLALFLLLLPPSLYAASYTLYIRSGDLTVNGAGGATLKVWGYTDNSTAAPMIPGPQLQSQEGETVTVTVYNQHTIPHNFVVRGITTDTASIAADPVSPLVAPTTVTRWPRASKTSSNMRPTNCRAMSLNESVGP